MAYNLPNMKLSDAELLWMRTVYSLMKKGQEIDVRTLKVELFEQLPKRFNPYRIDSRLLFSGNKLTLLGIWHVDPDTPLITKADEIIRAIREVLIKNPKRPEVSANEVSSMTGISRMEIDRLWGHVRALGSFNSRATTDSDGFLDLILVDQGGMFDEFLWYEGIEGLINSFFKRNEPQTSKNDVIEEENAETAHRVADLNLNPVFHSRITQVDYKLCFVLMPFQEKWSDRVYYDLIRKTVDGLGLQCLRADNLTGQIIIEDIWAKINQSAFIIADVTTRNPNVMYELGIVHTVGKPAILITQDLSTIPFDFTHLRHYEYEDNVDGDYYAHVVEAPF